MKSITDKSVLVKILDISAESKSTDMEAVNNRWENQIERVTPYGVQAYEFTNDLILLPYGVYPQFFENRAKINITHQTKSTAKITEIKTTKRTHQYSQIHILDLVWQSMDYFGVNEVPSKYQELVPDALRIIKPIKTELRRLNARYLEIHINWDSWYPVCIRKLDSCGYPLDSRLLVIKRTLANWQHLPSDARTQKAWDCIVEGIE
jgi:hypothetical protein